MHRYDELERLYYKKLIFKYSLIFLFFIILFIAGFLILNKENKKQIKSIEKSVKKQEKKVIPHKEKIKKSTKIKKRDNNLSKNKIKQKVKPVKNLEFVLPDLSKINVQKPASKEQKLKKTNNIKEINLNHTANIDTIKIVQKTPDLKSLIKSYNNEKDFDLAVMISKIYLKKNDLINAKEWALRANNINPSSYKSWILFADILLKEKKIKKAKEILRVYTNSYGQNDIIEKKLRSINDK